MADAKTQVLRRALEIIQTRGWTPHFSTKSLAGDEGPINLRTAVGLANHEAADGSYDAFINAIQCLTVMLGGVTVWEAGTSSGRPRTHDEVVGKLTEIVERLESDDPQGDGSLSHRRDFGARPAGKRNPPAGPTAV